MNGVTAHFRHSWPGFTLDVTLDLPGLWEARIVVQRGADSFAAIKRVMVP